MKTIRVKVKQDAYSWLNSAAKEVNYVWNWANETSEKAIRRFSGPPKWLSAYDLHALSAGSSALFNKIGAHTIQRVCAEYATRRKAIKAAKLSWRKSTGSRRSLGWVPFRAETLLRRGNRFGFYGKSIRVFEFDRLDGHKFHDGCFAQDSCGDWWLCVPVDVETAASTAPSETVGIDLGIKAIATTSDGASLHALSQLEVERRVGQAQRRGHRKAAKRLNRSAKNQRANHLHKFSRQIVNQYQNIFIGDVSSSKLKKTRMGKSIDDSAWYKLKMQLQYKGQQAGRRVEIVNEAYTTRACSSCGCLSGPGGLRQLAVRSWRCSECGAEHDRDINAARNIARIGLRYQPPLAGTSRTTHGYRRSGERGLKQEAK